MASSWRYGKRSKYRAKVSQDPDDYYRLDPKKSGAGNAYDIYTALCCRDTRDTKRLFLLNGLATLCQQSQHQHQHQQQQAKSSLGFTTEELLYCLSASLIHNFTQVRAAALRTIRYALATSKDIKIFNSMQLPHLLCRSIDVMLKNDDERVQALKLIRKMLAISPVDISPVLVRCLVSLADSGMEDGDNMLRACLATLCEFAVLNPTLLIVCGGVTSITRNVLECHNPRIAESLCGVLLYLLEWPHTRNISGVRLDCLAAPYCDFTYRLGIMDKNKDARELRYTSCRLALLSVLRSWTGTIEFCDPSKPSGLKAIVDALYLNQVEVRKAILDLLYELLGLSQPAWTDDFAIALQALDPSDFQDAWLLGNGFVAMEGRSILPSLAARAPNICEQHLALLLYCFLETGLLNALVEVIVSSDAHLSVRATMLIGKILHLMHTHLPADICSTSPALPTLISHATQGNQHATAAISALQSYQKMLRNRPASCSLFLDSIIQGGSLIHTRLFRRDINTQDQPHSGNAQIVASSGVVVYGPLQTGMISTLDRQRLDSVSSSDESNSQSSTSRRSSLRIKRRFLPAFFENLRVNRLIKDSNVLSLPDTSNAWEWEVVTTILRANLIRKLDDTTGKFLKRLLHYFKPSSNLFSHQELVPGRTVPPYVTAGLDIIDWLLACNELESMRLLTDFFSDVSQHLMAVSTSNRAHDCLFSPQHMNNTMCQQYFLYIGRMCRVQKGISILTNTAVFEHLINLVRNTDHVCYVKLIVSGLDYSLESVTRKVLEKALTSAKTRSGRLYATQFLVVLLRARIPNFEVWGIPMIIQQTKDPDRSVVLAAIDVLEEACHEKYYLEEIVRLWPNLKSLGDVGRLLMARYYSLSRGLNSQRARIKEEIDYWKSGYNKRYVLHVEADTHASLTLHVRNEDGYYSRRNCNTRPVIIPPNIPPHLYGQMVQTAQGTTALRKFGDLPHLVDVISRGKCSDDVECLELKAAIWAVGHASTHSNGIEYFVESGSRIHEKLVILATKCDVYSIRAICFNVLGLIGGTKAGANILFKLNWLSVRHDRNTIWPVHQPEDWMSSNYTPVRHHYEDMPPYNYTGIEDQIDGSYYTGSYWNLLLSSSSTTKEGGASASSEAQDANTTAESSKISEEASKQIVINTAKSKTLPEGTYMRHGKHQRSLSESKTTDVISLIGGPVVAGAVAAAGSAAQHQHRIRYNSCTDSNTSGVSSCESVTVRLVGGAGGGATTVSDFQQFPLSPIPSMSNLLELAPEIGMLKHTSLIGTSYLQNAISPVDIKGYAQLRSLRRHCRPVLSESAADLYDIIDSNELLSFATTRPAISYFRESQRRMKVRSLDRQSSLGLFTHRYSEPLPLPTMTAPIFLSQNDSKGLCYAGICLPKHLLDLFPKRNLSRTYVSRDIQDQDLMDINLLTAKQQFLNDSLNNEGGDESSVISSLSDVSSVSKRSKWLGAKHGRNNCLHCTRSRRNRTHSQRLDSDGTTTTAPCELYTNTTAALVVAGIHASVMLSRKTVTKQQPQQQQQLQPQQQQTNTQSSSTIQLSDISFNSPESILSEENMPDRLTANILYNVQRLANPVSAKQSKMALLELKQKHPVSFQDICLYSEVCKTLGRSSYRMNARRFLQELFLDLNFDSFYTEPTEILGKKEREFAVAAASEKPDITAVEKRLANLSLSGIKGSSSSETHLHPTKFNVALGTKTANTVAANVIGGIGSAALPSPSTSGTATTTNHVQTHKSHVKSQPLASVYETSCENLLLEQSPRLQAPVPSVKETAAAAALNKQQGKLYQQMQSSTAVAGAEQSVYNLKLAKKTFMNIAPPPAAPPPSQRVSKLQSPKRELEISEDDDLSLTMDIDVDDDNVDDDVKTPQKAVEIDEVDSSLHRMYIKLLPATNSNINKSCIQTAVISSSCLSTTPISSSNCSDQTTNSNRSSICTISQQHVNVNSSNLTKIPNTPTSSIPAIIPRIVENENKKYTRGRFYTLELDLSCTKNKFPIRDRNRDLSNASTVIPMASAAPVKTTQVHESGVVDVISDDNASALTTQSPTSAPDIPPTLHRQNSCSAGTSNSANLNYKLPVMRQSYTAGITPQIRYVNTANTTSCTGSSNSGTAFTYSAKVTDLSPTSCTTSTSSIGSYTITKSLAASLAKPIGSLFCEKRLQSSKSEAVLSTVPPAGVVSGTTKTLPATTTALPTTPTAMTAPSGVFQQPS